MAVQSPRAWKRAARVETATVIPTEVRESSTEKTGMISWYRPMTSAPISRERAIR